MNKNNLEIGERGRSWVRSKEVRLKRRGEKRSEGEALGMEER